MFLDDNHDDSEFVFKSTKLIFVEMQQSEMPGRGEGTARILHILSSQFPQVGQHALDYCEKDRLQLSEMNRVRVVVETKN